jgi:hypothetical protein
LRACAVPPSDDSSGSKFLNTAIVVKITPHEECRVDAIKRVISAERDYFSRKGLFKQKGISPAELQLSEIPS